MKLFSIGTAVAITLLFSIQLYTLKKVNEIIKMYSNKEIAQDSIDLENSNVIAKLHQRLTESNSKILILEQRFASIATNLQNQRKTLAGLGKRLDQGDKIEKDPRPTAPSTSKDIELVFEKVRTEKMTSNQASLSNVKDIFDNLEDISPEVLSVDCYGKICRTEIKYVAELSEKKLIEDLPFQSYQSFPRLTFVEAKSSNSGNTIIYLQM